jgi:hypothetical protein
LNLPNNVEKVSGEEAYSIEKIANWRDGEIAKGLKRDL